MITVSSSPPGALYCDIQTDANGVCLYVRKRSDDLCAAAIEIDNFDLIVLVGSWIEDRLNVAWQDAPRDVRRIQRALLVSEIEKAAFDLHESRRKGGAA